jgi:hypothetical protein
MIGISPKLIIRTYCTKLVHGKQCKPDIQKLQTRLGKVGSTHLVIEKCRWNKRYKVCPHTTSSPFMRERTMNVHMHG